jgi:site-specific DNA-methyltransferase (adenine-specific)
MSATAAQVLRRPTPALLPQQAPGLSPQSAHARGEGWRLYAGDSLALLSRLDAQSVDLVVVDRPEGQAPEALADAEAWLAEARRVLKPTGSLWVSGAPAQLFPVGFGVQRLGMKLLNTVTWYRPSASPRPGASHSTALLLWASPGGKGKLRHTFNYPAMKAENGGKQMRDVWALPPDVASAAEGGARPLALLRRMVEAATPADGVVVEPFCTSATAGVAAVSLGRRYVGLGEEGRALSLARARLERL